MKILFFSQDDAVVDLIEGVGHQNMIVTDDVQFVLDHSESARCLIFLDFDENKKEAEKLNKQLMDGDDVRIVMTEKIKLKELKKHQKGATAADGYVRKPISLKIINEILNDFELSDYIQASEAFEEGDQLGEVPLSSIEGADSEFDEESAVDFDAGVMKVDDRVKKQLDAHSVSSETGPNFATPLNVDIQSKFDMVFDRPFLPERTKSKVNIPAPQEQQAGGPASISPIEEGGFDLDMGADEEGEEDLDINLGEEDSLDVGLSMDEDESDDLDINLSEETESEELDLGSEESLEADSSQEEAMEDDNDLDFDVEENEAEELDEGALEFGGAAETLEEEPEDEQVEGLDFATAEESDDALAINEESESPEENNEEAGGFDLGSDDSDDALDLGSDDSAGALDLGDDEDALDLGSDDSAGALDLGSDDSSDALDLGSDDSSGALDLGSDDALDLGSDDALDLGSDDSSGALDLGSEDDALDLGSDDALDLGSDDELEASEEEMDLGESEDDSLDLGEPDSLDADDSFDEVSTTIEGIIAVNEDADEDGELNILSDGDDLDSEEEDLSFSEDEEDEFEKGTLTGTDSEVLDFSDDEEVGESTNPTIVMGSEDNSLKEFKASLPVESLDDEDELDLSEIEEDTGVDLLADDDVEESIDVDSDEKEFDDDLTITEVLETTKPIADAAGSLKEEETAPVAAPKVASTVDEQIIITPEDQRVAEAFNQTEQTRLQGTIRQLREEREELLKEIHELKTESKLGDQDKLGLRAELDEAKIEIQILKKRNHDEIDELKYRVRLSEEKKHIYEERAKSVQKEFDRLNQKVRIDINQVKQREKELESQLELISMDSQSQVKSRDMKILDLKRKIDSLEFNMENASIREVKSREDKEKVEERLEKIMRTLRGSLKSLESENDFDDGILDKIDKL